MLKKILQAFGLDGEIISKAANNCGNINNTFCVEVKLKTGECKKLLIQKVNTYVFPNPWQLMDNIEKVTDYLKKQSAKEKDKTHTVLELYKTPAGKTLCVIANNGNKEYYRIYKYIENSIVFDNLTDPKIAYATGKAFGNFQRLLNDYPINTLFETIKDFHDTPKRLANLKNNIKLNPVGRVEEAQNEINFIMSRQECCSLICSKLGKTLPYRVTHNDTKVNNVIMNKTTGDFLAVIDFDTVMPGSLLFDYGDGIRSSTSTAKEDETDLNKVSIDLNLFKAYTDGFMSEMAAKITPNELDLMAESIKVITLELAIRFLDDYICGDIYFKTKYPRHNLDRAKNQLKLVLDIENKLDTLKDYIYKSYLQHKQN